MAPIRSSTGASASARRWRPARARRDRPGHPWGRVVGPARRSSAYGRVMARAKRATVEQVPSSRSRCRASPSSRPGPTPSTRWAAEDFIFFRNPRPDAFDPETGERYTDVIVFGSPTRSTRRRSWRTTPTRSSPRHTSTDTARCCCGQPDRGADRRRARRGGVRRVAGPRRRDVRGRSGWPPAGSPTELSLVEEGALSACARDQGFARWLGFETVALRFLLNQRVARQRCTRGLHTDHDPGRQVGEGGRRRGGRLVGLAVYDVTQRQHAILRNFPVVGHLRFLLERSAPSCASTSSPTTTRSGRSAATSAAGSTPRPSCENNYFGFGTDNDVEHADGYPIIKHRAFPGEGAPTARHAGDEVLLPCAKVLGGPRGRRHAFRPASVVNISAMSFGSLSQQRRRGAQPRRRAGRLPAQHRRGRALAVPPQRRRPRLADRHRLLRVPRRARRASTSARLEDLVAGAPGAGDRDQALAGRQARARRHASRAPR